MLLGISSNKKPQSSFSGITGYRVSWVNTEKIQFFLEAYFKNFTKRMEAPADPKGGKYLEIINTLDKSNTYLGFSFCSIAL